MFRALLIGGAVVGIGSTIAIVFQKTKYKVQDRILVADYSIAQKILYPTFFIAEGTIILFYFILYLFFIYLFTYLFIFSLFIFHLFIIVVLIFKMIF